jgi:hypothetical protein
MNLAQTTQLFATQCPKSLPIANVATIGKKSVLAVPSLSKAVVELVVIKALPALTVKWELLLTSLRLLTLLRLKLLTMAQTKN